MKIKTLMGALAVYVAVLSTACTNTQYTPDNTISKIEANKTGEKKMEKYTIFSDYHVGHPWALTPDFTFDKNTVFLGDNFDLVNTRRDNLNKVIAFRNETMKKCADAGGIYVSGNHSLEKMLNKQDYVAVRDSIAFIHGDVIEWGYGRSNAYRTLHWPGKNALIWNMVKSYREKNPGYISELTDKEIAKTVTLAKDNHCNTIVMGHFHPEYGRLDTVVDEVRIVVVPQGKTVMEL